MTRLSALLAATALTASAAWAQTAPVAPAPTDSQPPAAAAPASPGQPAAAPAAAQPAATPAAEQPVAAAPAPAEQTQEQGLSGEGDCPAPDTMAQPATMPQPGADSTDANNAGSSGWSGGLGGSQLGTNAQGAVTASPTWQPPTARGLDLKGKAEPVAMTAPAPEC